MKLNYEAYYGAITFMLLLLLLLFVCLFAFAIYFSVPQNLGEL